MVTVHGGMVVFIYYVNIDNVERQVFEQFISCL